MGSDATTMREVEPGNKTGVYYITISNVSIFLERGYIRTALRLLQLFPFSHEQDMGNRPFSSNIMTCLYITHHDIPSVSDCANV